MQMADRPGAEAQKAAIAGCRGSSVPVCYMVHKRWLESWRDYVNLFGKSQQSQRTEAPGYVSNTELV